MRNNVHIPVIQTRHEILPPRHHLPVRAVILVRPPEHIRLDRLQQRWHVLVERADRDGRLPLLVPPRRRNHVVGAVLGPELQAQRHAFEFPVVEFPAGGIIPVVDQRADVAGFEHGEESLRLFQEALAVLGRGLCGEADGHDDDLEFGGARREDEALVVAVHEDHDADGASRKAPAVLPDVDGRFLLTFFRAGVLDGDVEHLAEVLSQAVGCAGLDATACGRDEAFDGGGVVCAREFLVVGLDALDDGDGQEVFIYGGVVVEDLSYFFAGAFFRQMRCVAFLPEKFAGAQKWHGVFEFPPDDVIPLVQPEREVTMGADFLGVMRVHGCLRGRAHGKSLG